MNARLALALAVITVVATLPPAAQAMVPDCGATTDVGPEGRSVPLTGNAGACDGALEEDDQDVYTWSVPRAWDLHVTLALQDAGTARVTRIVGTTTIATAQGTGTLVLPQDVTSFLSIRDQLLTERIVIDRNDAGVSPLRYRLEVSRAPPPNQDCGQGDATASAPVTLIAGTCRATLVDGDTLPGADNEDFFTIPADDGDIVRLAFVGDGRSYSHRLSNGSSWRVTTPDSFGNYAFVQGATPLGFEVKRGYPDYELEWQPGWCFDGSCMTSGGYVPVNYYDSYSVAPFTYRIDTTIIPNARPVVTTTPIPAALPAHALLSFDATFVDPDGDMIEPIVMLGSVRWDSGERVPSGTTLHFDLDPGFEGWRTWVWLTISAVDAKGAPAYAGVPPEYRIDHYPGDCPRTGADAPAAGFVLVAPCEGWVGEGVDPEDLFLVPIPAGGHNVTLAGSAGFEVTFPDGRVRTTVGYDAMRDWVEGPATVQVRARGLGHYSITPTLVASPQPLGRALVYGVLQTSYYNGSTEPDGRNISLARGQSVSRTFNVPSWADGATIQGVWIHGEGKECTSDMDSCFRATLNNRTSYTRAFDGCTPAGGDGWVYASLNDGLATHVGPNTVTIGRSTSPHTQWFNLSRAGDTYAWVLEVKLKQPVGLREGQPVVVYVKVDDPLVEAADLVVDFGDGATQSLHVPPRRSIATLHTYTAAANYTLRIDGTSLPTGRPLLHETRLMSILDTGDCGEKRDIPTWGRNVTNRATCEGFVGHGDAEDKFTYSFPPERTRIRITLDGAVNATIVNKTGDPVPLVNGVATDYFWGQAPLGDYTIRVKPTTGARTPYSFRVDADPMPAPTGRLDVQWDSILVRTGEPLALSHRAMDSRYRDLSTTLDWGDGATASVAEPTLNDWTSHAHAYATDGLYPLVLWSAADDGRLLGVWNRMITSATPTDCGAGDAPTEKGWTATLLAPGADYAPLAGARCYGSLDASDIEDAYGFAIQPGAPFSVRIREGQGLNLATRIMLVQDGRLLPVGHATFLGAAGYTTTTEADGARVLRMPGGTLATGEYALIVERTAGAGVYEVEIRS